MKSINGVTSLNPLRITNASGHATNHTITIDEVMSGRLFIVVTTAGEVTFTLPKVDDIPKDDIFYQIMINHVAGNNNVKVVTHSGDEFAWGNTYFNLGSHLFNFTIAGTNSVMGGAWSIVRNLTVKASAHRNANWASSNFSSSAIVPWDDEEYNNQSELLVYTSGTSSRYTVQATGTYKVNYTIDIDSTGGGTWNATSQVYKNGSALDNTQVRTGNYGNEDQSMCLPCTYVSLVVGDYIDLRIDQNNLTGNLVHSSLNLEIRL